MAFINADWRDFQNTPAKNETRVNSILINDYLRILNQSGWEETHIFQAPLSSERFKANVVSGHAKEKDNRCDQQVRHHFKEKIGF